jgi:hypothetical protein
MGKAVAVLAVVVVGLIALGGSASAASVAGNRVGVLLQDLSLRDSHSLFFGDLEGTLSICGRASALARGLLPPTARAFHARRSERITFRSLIFGLIFPSAPALRWLVRIESATLSSAAARDVSRRCRLSPWPARLAHRVRADGNWPCILGQSGCFIACFPRRCILLQARGGAFLRCFLAQAVGRGARLAACASTNADGAFGARGDLQRADIT